MMNNFFRSHAPQLAGRGRLLRSAALMMSLLLASSCGSMLPQERGRPDSAGRDTETGLPSDAVLFTNTDDEQSEGVTSEELYKGTGEFIDVEAASTSVRTVSDDGQIVLNFEGESIQSVVHTILGEVLQETFVIGPGVSGQVTFATSRPVNRDQLMPILELLLRWNGATLVYTDGRYNILPVSDAIRGHLVPKLGGLDGIHGYEVRVVPLEYISPSEMAKILEPYVREGAIVSVDVMRGMIFLAGTREDLANYMQTIRIFDVDWLAGMSVGIYPLNTVDVESISAELTAIFGMEAESPLAGLFRFVPLERLGSIMVITPRPEYLDKARVWIERLDRGAAGSGVQLFVYRVKNLEAAILANYLTTLFGGQLTDTDRPRPTNLSPGLEPVTTGSLSNFNDNRQQANDAGLSGNNNRRSGSGSAVIEHEGGQIRITSVIETNSLLIQSTQSQYGSILAAIERIDTEPLQVLIEAQVLDVTLNESLEFGVNWFLSNDPDLAALGGTNEYSFGAATEDQGNNLFALLTDTISGNYLQVAIAALDSVTDVRSMAAPSLVVQNNAQATITVGTQVPVQSSSISTGVGNNVISSAQYISTGITLTVTPRINPGGLVYMDISQEVTRPGARDENFSTSGNPPIDTKAVSSQVAIQSGETVFLGGLISEQESRGRAGVPFLSRIPGLGALFGSNSTARIRSEIVVLITPTVLESSAEIRAVTEDLRDEFMNVPPIKISTLQGN